jgi:peptidoglycan hydrolase-like protein with peptidoglycan-binding domain
VKALQCFLRKAHVYHGRVHGRYHRGTLKAVKRLQRRTDTLAVTGKADRKTWTSLLARGSDPLLKYGSRANSVRRLQRSLNAATGARIDVSGVFDRRTQKMVKRYQKGRDLPRTGVVTAVTWDQLQQGRR